VSKVCVTLWPGDIVSDGVPSGSVTLCVKSSSLVQVTVAPFGTTIAAGANL